MPDAPAAGPPPGPPPVAPPSDTELRQLFQAARTIAIVGLSEDPSKESHQIGLYLREAGYRVIAVNPGITSLWGEKAWGSIEVIPEPLDIIDVFRKPEATPPIAAGAVRRKAKCLWLQTGIVNQAAANTAKNGGLLVIQGRCIRTEHRRLMTP